MVVSVQNVSFSIGKNKILDGVSLEIERGTFFSVFGPDDAGKTTLLRVLCGFCQADEGTAEREGELRFVPDDIIWESSMTGRQYLDFCRGNSPYYKEDIEEFLCGLFEPALDRSLTGLTYGENKALQLIGAVSAMPDLLVLDEPRNFLDKKNYRKLLACLETFCGQGMTVLLAAEAYADVRTYCTHYAYLNEGQIVKTGRVSKPDIHRKVVGLRCEKGMKMPALGKPLAVRRGRAYYLYQGDSSELFQKLLRAGCEDVTVEELTLEEEIDEDYERWL